MTENAPEMCAPEVRARRCAPEGIRTPNLLIRSQNRHISRYLTLSR
jgi:hypothetical protein